MCKVSKGNDERMAEIKKTGRIDGLAAEHTISNLWACRQWKLWKLSSLSQVLVQIPGSSCSSVCATASQQYSTLVLWAVFPDEHDLLPLSYSLTSLAE